MIRNKLCFKMTAVFSALLILLCSVSVRASASDDVKIWQLLDHCSGIPNSTMVKMLSGTDHDFRGYDAMARCTART